MTFQEAKEKLDFLANGRFHSMSYELVTHSNGSLDAECGIYIEGTPFCSGETWDEAFISLMQQFPAYEPLTNDRALAMAPVEDYKLAE